MAHPLFCVYGPDQTTHLIVLSPALPGAGHRDGQLTLCGQPVMSPCAENAGNVACDVCLHRAPQFMGYAPFGVIR